MLIFQRYIQIDVSQIRKNINCTFIQTCRVSEITCLPIQIYLGISILTFDLSMGCCVTQVQNNSSLPKVPLFAPSLTPQFAFTPIPQDKSLSVPLIIHPILSLFLVRNQTSIDLDVKLKVNSLFENYSICKETNSLLESFAHTSEHVISMANAIINSVIQIEQDESAEEIEAVNEQFNKQNQRKVEKDLMFYREIDSLVKMKLNTTKIKTKSASRIYNNIANIRKNQVINEEKVNQFGIACQRTNGYKKLTVDELQEVIKYEFVADEIAKLGSQMNMRFLSIKQGSQGMTQMLSQCFAKHSVFIRDLTYNLADEEVLQVASISLEACTHYENGTFFIFLYLVRACRKLEQQKNSIEKIEERLGNAIRKISQTYPPGQGLSEEQQHLKTALENLQDPKEYAKVQFFHKQIILNPSQKQIQVEEIIVQYSQLAQSNKALFEELLHATCLKRCVSFKTGLKINPHAPNRKALTRIKEKMFFGKSESGNFVMQGTVKEVIEREEKDYLLKVDQLLEKRQSVFFKISDMVRGKCIFLEVTDIIETVNEIKRYIANDSRFGLAQIESRFTNKIPISDVTLKIILNNQIVAELQLTIQTNAAIYNFAHKIYQLQRTKIFSKIKITHNYFEEFKQDFKELAATAICLITAEKYKEDKVLKTECEAIANQFFELNTVKPITLKQSLQIIFQQQKKKIPTLKNSIDPTLQNLIFPLFQCQMGKWDKEVGKGIQQTLQMNVSPRLKATLLAQFFGKFDITKELNRMEQFFLTDQQIQNKCIYMNQYLRYYFNLETAFNYVFESHRVFHRGQQLLQITFVKNNEQLPIKPKEIKFIQNLVVEGNSFEAFTIVKQLAIFYFHIRKEEGKFYDDFQKYCHWLFSMINQNEHLDKNKITDSEIKVLKAQKLVIDSKGKEAEKLFQETKVQFKMKSNYLKALECELFLFECLVMTDHFNTLKDADGYYSKKVEQQSITLGLKIRGGLVADSLARISRYLWKRYQQREDRKLILKKYWNKAIKQLSRSRGKQLIYALKQIWKQYSNYDEPLSEIAENEGVEYEKLQGLKDNCQHLTKVKWPKLKGLNLASNDIGPKGCQYLSSTNWKLLTSLDLSCNNIGPQGCQYLSRAQWRHLTSLNLYRNAISQAGCEYLSKAEWPNLLSLNLDRNRIEAIGCDYLRTADWKYLKQLNFGSNEIGDTGCEYLCKADWKELISLNLSENKIGYAGCEYLSKSDWKNLKSLILSINNISSNGCQYLSQAQWKRLEYLNLSSSYIGPEGCQHLSKADWKNLSYLNLNFNKIGQNGCQHLSRADWKNLAILHLNINKIQAVGCQFLSKASWNNLNYLSLFNNNIGDAGCQYLSRADWKNLVYLNLVENNIGINGCQFLSKAIWKCLKCLDLSFNSIGQAGQDHLARAEWDNLKELRISNQLFGSNNEKKKQKEQRLVSIISQNHKRI